MGERGDAPERMAILWRSFLCILVLTAALTSGCASLPPGAYHAKTLSVAWDHPEQTVLGRKFEDTAREHGSLSGFHMLSMGVDGFLVRAEMIGSAEHTIDLQYFIFRNDDAGRLLAGALLRAADRGVRVRLLIDDAETIDGDERIAALQAHPHIEVRIFNPFAYRGHSKLIRSLEFLFNKSRLDYRMHNKLLVVDNALALVGGRNVGDDYFQMDPSSQFGDDDVFTVGPVVKKLSDTFDQYWNSTLAIPAGALGKPSDTALDAYRLELTEHSRKLQQAGAPYAARLASNEPLAGMVSGTLPLVWAAARVVYDNPDKSRIEKGEMIGELLSPAVSRYVAAVQSELLMLTPYLIPGAEGLQLLRNLRQRQVRVRILTNSLVSTNVLEAHSGYMHYRLPLLESGVELFEIRAWLGSSKGSGQSKAMTRFGTYALHGKLFVFDRRKLYIGSMNFDQRSMHLNTEVGLIIDSPELAEQAATRFQALASLKNSYLVLLRSGQAGGAPHLLWRTEEDGKLVDYTQEPARSPWQRAKVNLMSLLPLDKEL